MERNQSCSCVCFDSQITFLCHPTARVYKEMLDNIMNPLLIQEEINIVRYSIYHPMATSANTFIGRAAHIAMLDSELFLEKFILITASKYFR